MDRRIFVASGAAAIVARAIPAAAQDAVEVAVTQHYALVMICQFSGEPPVDVLTIAPRGRVTVASGWTIERAMTMVWPQPGKWWEADHIREFLGVSYRDDPNSFTGTVVINDPPYPMPRDEHLVAVITTDGNVEFGPQFDGDESDRTAWNKMGRMFVNLAAL